MALLRKLKQRGVDVGDPCVLAGHLGGKTSAPHGVMLVDISSKPFVPLWTKARLGLENLHFIILAAMAEQPVDIAAEHAGAAESTAEELLVAWRRHSGRCAYSYGKTRSAGSVKSSHPPVPTQGEGDDLYQAFSELLEKLGDLEIKEGLEVWADNYRASVPGLAIRTPRDARYIQALLNALDINKERIVLSRPDNWPYEVWEQWKNDLNLIGFNYSHGDFHTQSKTVSSSEYLWLSIRLISAKGSSRRSMNMKRFHQFCYLAWFSSMVSA